MARHQPGRGLSESLALQRSPISTLSPGQVSPEDGRCRYQALRSLSPPTPMNLSLFSHTKKGLEESFLLNISAQAES